MSSTPHSIGMTLGALEAGGFVAIFLSGIVSMQTYLYYRIYPKDKLYLKCLVGAVWTMDFVHTLMICIANWRYLVRHFGDYTQVNHLIWPIAVTVTFTAIVTALVHAFFTHRIYIVSKRKKIIAIPLGILALFRLTLALVSTAEMIRLMSYPQFVSGYEWVFTVGLSSAVALDIFVTVSLSHYLRKSKTGFASMNQIIDSLVLYTVETGIITCAATIASLVTWVTMPHCLVYLAIHFTISKLYANSFLATLNSRAVLRSRSMASSTSDPPSTPATIPNAQRRGIAGPRSRRSADPLSPAFLQITVEKTIETEVDGIITNVDLGKLDEEASPNSIDDSSASSYIRSMRSRSDGASHNMDYV